MSLRSKILLILACVVAAYVGVDHLVQRQVFTSRFATEERARAERDLERVVAVLSDEMSEMAVRADDWTSRSSVRTAVGRGDTGALEEELRVGLDELALDLLYVCRADGHVLLSRTESPGTREPIRVRKLPGESLSAHHALLTRTLGRGSTEGILMTEHGALLVGSSVVPSAEGGDAGGIVILGRFLDQEGERMLEELSRVRFELSSLTSPALAPEEASVLDRVTTSTEPVHWSDPGGDLHVFTDLWDVEGKEGILLRTTVEPEITRSGERLMSYALASALGTGFVILLLLLRLLSRIVIDPLGRLTASAVQIGRTDDTSVRTGIDRSDEIGQLSSEFDSMLEKLEASRQEVIRTARLAGMSEIATGVLHNMGNVLNSVNVSTNLVTRRVEELPVDDLLAMRDVLTENEADLARFVTEDPRGKHLLPFLGELCESLEERKRQVQDELRGLRGGVEHIGELVRSQQTMAGRAGVLEPTSLADQINAAVVICRQAGKAAADVEIVRDYEELPRVETDRHKLMEILVNLVKNALDAVATDGTERPRVVLRLRSAPSERVRIEVEDNGPGIPPENLARVFNHGFTTKPDGHGYGLHVSANAATEMKGKLYAEDDGPEGGARFVLELPAPPAQEARAA